MRDLSPAVGMSVDDWVSEFFKTLSVHASRLAPRAVSCYTVNNARRGQPVVEFTGCRHSPRYAL
jgi:hypothetical protein